MTSRLYGKSRALCKADTPTALFGALDELLDPDSGAAEMRAAARAFDRAQTTSLSALPLHQAMGHALHRLFRPAPGHLLLPEILARVPAPEAARVLRVAPGLEPLSAGAQRFVSAGPSVLSPLGSRTDSTVGNSTARAVAHVNSAVSTCARASLAGRRESVRQGRLGDCWLIAVLDACEAVAPGFLRTLITAEEGSGEVSDFVTVTLHTPITAIPLVRRMPGMPLSRAPVTISTRVPLDRRAGDRGLRPSTASLVEKAAVVVWARGAYGRLAFDFAGTALALTTGRWCLARPVPLGVGTVQKWLSAGRPVVASTLVRPGGSFLVPYEDDPSRHVALMDGHVYAVHRVMRCDEDGRPDPSQPLRVHLRNPLGGREGSQARGEPRRNDVYLSARQFRRAFISVNVGPALPNSTP